MNKAIIEGLSNRRVSNYGMLLFTLVYILSSIAGYLLVFAPSEASAFWPAAGVGLAVLLIGGVSLWPAIFLGDFIFNIMKYEGSNSAFSSAGWLALDALGPTLQAVVGALYIGKYLQANLEGDFLSIVKTYVIGVVLICMISPTIGAGALVLEGGYPNAQFWAFWFFWWIGDSIGVMLFAPIILWLAYNARDGMTEKYALVIPHLALSTVLLLYAIFWFQSTEKQSYTNALIDESEQALSIFNERLALAASAIESVQRYITVEGEISEASLAPYIERIDELGVRAISWMPRVSHASRSQTPIVPGFDTGAGFDIMVRNAEGEYVSSPDREEYFPIVYNPSQALSERFVGYDPSANASHKEALDRARDNNAIVLSSTFSRSFGEQARFVFYAPVYSAALEEQSATVSARRENLRGFVVGLINPATLLTPVIEQTTQSQLSFIVVDPNDGESVVLTQSPDTNLLEMLPLESRPLAVFGRELAWSAYAPPDFWVPGASLQSRLFLLVLLFIVMIISFLMLGVLARALLVNEKVKARTKELNIERTKLRQAMDIANILPLSINLVDKTVTMDDSGFALLKTNAEIEGGYQFTLEKWLLRFVYKDDRECLRERICAEDWAQRATEEHEIECRLRRRDGCIRHVILRFNAQYDTAGHVFMLLGTAQDVTPEKEMVLALRESEQYSRSIIESSHDCIKVHDLDGAILSITDHGMEAMDITDRKQVLNVNWITFWEREQDRKALLIAFDEARAGRVGRFQGFAATMRGVPKWWDVHISAITDIEGNVERLLSVSRDVTSERNSTIALEQLNARLEEEVHARTLELANSERRYRSMFDNNPIPMWVYQKDNLRFTAVNEAAIASYGYSREQFLAMSLAELEPEGAGYNPLLDPKRFDHRGSIRIEAAAHMRKDGSHLYVDISCSELSEENNEFNLLIANDITERLEASAALRKQQEMTRLILENLSEGVIACDSAGELMLFNKSAREWHGADPRKMPAQRWSAHYGLYEADGETLLALERVPLMRAFQGETVRGAEVVIRKQGGVPRFVLANGAPLTGGDGEKVGAVVVVHDVTERKKAQRELEESACQLRLANREVENERAKLAERVAQRTAELTQANEQLQAAKAEAEAGSRAKSSFLAVMSHEIRTPMNGIVGMVDVLSHSKLDEQHAAAVRTIKESAFSLLSIIDDILDFSKIEASRMDLERAPVNLVQVLEGVVDTLAPLSADKQVSVGVYVAPDFPKSVWGDAKRLRQILMNLLSNAIKFSSGRPDKPGVVKVSIEINAKAQDSYVIKVKDNGIGIRKEQVPKLFSSFSQAETSTTRVFGGTGLGLAICKRLVELMEGAIAVVSEYGEGAEFTVTLPLQAVDALAGVKSNKLYDLTGLSCIVVEHDDEAFQHLQSYLQHAGASVVRCESLGAAALHSTENKNGDIVVIYKTGLHSPNSNTMQSLVSAYKEVKFFFINFGRRSIPRIVGPNLVSMDDPFVRQDDFLHGVAIAAGRASARRRDEKQEPMQLDDVRAPSVEEARSQGQLILVAEDDKTNQSVILRQLHMLGYAAEIAADGLQAWQMWLKGDYACLLTDLHMPKMDGYELTKKIRAMQGVDVHKPILLLTANALSGELEKAKALGVDEYLTKPLQLQVLGEVLSRWLPGNAPNSESSAHAKSGRHSAEGASFDLKVLAMSIGEDSGVIKEVLGEYLESTLKLRQALVAAGHAGESQRVGSLAHRLKGSSQIVGALRLGAMCAKLEEASRSADYTALRELIAEIEHEWEEVAVAIREAIAA